jgi:hypothetical protein
VGLALLRRPPLGLAARRGGLVEGVLADVRDLFLGQAHHHAHTLGDVRRAHGTAGEVLELDLGLVEIGAHRVEELGELPHLRGGRVTGAVRVLEVELQAGDSFVHLSLVVTTKDNVEMRCAGSRLPGSISPGHMAHPTEIVAKIVTRSG